MGDEGAAARLAPRRDRARRRTSRRAMAARRRGPCGNRAEPGRRRSVPRSCSWCPACWRGSGRGNRRQPDRRARRRAGSARTRRRVDRKRAARADAGWHCHRRARSGAAGGIGRASAGAAARRCRAARADPSAGSRRRCGRRARCRLRERSSAGCAHPRAEQRRIVAAAGLDRDLGARRDAAVEPQAVPHRLRHAGCRTTRVARHRLHGIKLARLLDGAGEARLRRRCRSWLCPGR